MLQKIENYKNALSQLEDAVQRYQKSPGDSLYRDGLIHRGAGLEIHQRVS